MLFQLRQLRRIRRSLDDDSIARLVHAFVANHVDYCVSLLAGSPKKKIAKLQRVLNVAARVVSNCGKYDPRETHFRRHVLHWLDFYDRIRFQLCIQVYKMSTQHGSWIPDRSLPASRQHWWSRTSAICKPWLAARIKPVPRIKMATYGNHAFGHAGP